MTTFETVKLNSAFEFPDVLDLSEFVSTSDGSNKNSWKDNTNEEPAAKRSKTESAPNSPIGSPWRASAVHQNDNIFILHAVLVHRGDVN